MCYFFLNNFIIPKRTYILLTTFSIRSDIKVEVDTSRDIKHNTVNNYGYGKNIVQVIFYRKF